MAQLISDMPKLKYFLFLTFLLFSFASFSTSAKTVEKSDLLAKLYTNKGIITARLFYRRAPLTVMNFVGLAEGTLAWTHPTTEKQTTEPLYQNLIFHHVRDFMIQTGDPTGNGTGGPGFMFANEIHPELRHHKAGILSMANRGPNTNGSQFFITRQPTEWLDNYHTVFGEVIEGFEVVAQIVREDKLERIEIIRIGAAVHAFNPKQAHEFAKINQNALRETMQKVLPDKEIPLDSHKMPKPEQPSVSPGDFEFIVLGHTQMRVQPPGKVFYQDHQAALAFAKQLVRYARSQGIAFDALIKQYSDMDRDTRTRNVTDKGLPPPMRSIFRLKPGQISEPLDLPIGIYIFHRLVPEKN